MQGRGRKWGLIAIVLTSLAACAQDAKAPSAAAPETKAPDAAAGPPAKKPSNELAAQRAVTTYLALWVKHPETAKFAFRPLATGNVSLGFGLKETGWFMCGTVEQTNAALPDQGRRVFFAHFDPQQPDIIDGAVDFVTGYGLVSHWCAEVYR